MSSELRRASADEAGNRLRGSLETHIGRLAAFTAVLALALSANSARADTLIGSGWSGWIAEVNLPKHFSDVNGSWIEPDATCTKQTSEASFWVGLGGAGLPSESSNAFYGPLQIGTDSDCTKDNARYFSWWEAYPDPEIELQHDPVQPGDEITASVEASPGDVEFQIADLTRGWKFRKVKRMHLKPLATTSAEWITEGPIVSSFPALLTNFGQVYFMDSTATADGITRPISSPTWKAIPNTSGDGNIATPGPLIDDGSAFSVTISTPK